MLLDNYSKWLISALSPAAYSMHAQGWDLMFRVRPNDLRGVLLFLRNSAGSSFKSLSDIAVLDRPSSYNRFSIVYNLLSIKYQARIFVRTSIPEGLSIPSIVPLFTGADWMEREA